MNKQDVYALLDENGFWHEITEHKAVYNMAELAEVECPYPEADAKNLFVRDDKKRNYYLITVKGDKRKASLNLSPLLVTATPCQLPPYRGSLSEVPAICQTPI